MRGGMLMVGRSPASWMARLALAIVVLVVGYQGQIYSIGRSLVAVDPERAHRLAPDVGFVTGRYAEALSNADLTQSGLSHAAELARLALYQDQTMVAALSTLGTEADSRGDTAAARRFFDYAHRLSRRDLRTQLWMIEDAVDRGQVDQALHQYDLTLRVAPGMGSLLYPVLTTASSDPAIQNGLVKVLARSPPWGDTFMTYMIGHGRDPISLYGMITKLQRISAAVQPTARAAAVNALLYSRRNDYAWSYYAMMRRGADRQQLRNVRFTAGPEVPSLLDWVPRAENGAVATVDGVFDFSAPTNVGGVLLEQYQLLSPGKYQLIGRSNGIDQAENSRPYWVLKCIDGRELGRVVLPNSTDAGGHFDGVFDVPTGCPVQVLAFVARPSDAVAGLAGQISTVQFRR